MRILITGNQGFIGTHLTKELTDAGHQVFGHDHQDGDLTQLGVFEATVERVAPDQVVHLAAQVGRLFGEQDIEYTIRQNVLMTGLVAHACGERRIPLLYASTSEVYGDCGQLTCVEEPAEMWQTSRLPHNAYGLTKRQGEEFCRLYAPQDLRIVRLSMPYGPGAPPGRGRRAMDNFLWWALHGKPITVHAGAERSWCWVGDTVRGIRMVLEDSQDLIYNIGRDDQRVSMRELAEMACDLTGAPYSLIEVIEPPARQTVVKRLSTRRLRSLGWKPTVELEDGMRVVLEWVRQFDADGHLLTREAA